MGVDEHSRHFIQAAARKGGNWRPVAVAVGEIGTDQHDLAGQPRLRQQLDGLRRKNAKGRRSGVGPETVGQGQDLAGNGGAQNPGQGRGKSRNEFPAPVPAGKDPADDGVAAIGHEIHQALVHPFQVDLEKSRLFFRQMILPRRPGGYQRHLEIAQNIAQFGVLRGLRRLVEKDVEPDGAHLRRRERPQQAGEKTAVQGRTVGQGRQGVLGDGNDDDVGMLGLGWRQGCQTNVPDTVFSRPDKRKQTRKQQAGDHREDDDRRYLNGFRLG